MTSAGVIDSSSEGGGGRGEPIAAVAVMGALVFITGIIIFLYVIVRGLMIATDRPVGVAATLAATAEVESLIVWALVSAVIMGVGGAMMKAKNKKKEE